MKRLLLFTLTLSLFVAVWAKPVSEQAAIAVAKRYLQHAELKAERWGEIYIVAPVADEGYVLVAADDCVKPVLAYSLHNSFSTSNMPDNVRAWIAGYCREIESLRNAGVAPSAAVSSMWQQDGHPLTLAFDSVAPLLTTRWDQGTYYNRHCPYDAEDGQYTYTGCVATATAQIMKYWNHPAVGMGSHSYDGGRYSTLSADFASTAYQWDIMPNTLNWQTDSAAVEAVAELMYHVGVGVEMNYGTSASGAQIISFGMSDFHSSEYALLNYFKYSPLMRGIQKSSYNDAEWDALMRNEIFHHRPILYAGHDDAGGHAFVLDGFDGDNMFHVNWGWGGYNDGYYTIDSLSPGAGGVGGNATYTFNLYNQALIGIEACPESENGQASVFFWSEDVSKGTTSGGGIYNACVDTVFITAHAMEGYRFVGWKHSGSTSNPLRFLAVGDIEDTAVFCEVGVDTIGFCSYRVFSSWHDDYSNRTEWGICVPSALRAEKRSLSAIQMYVTQQDLYTVRIYLGDSISEANLIYDEDIIRDFSGQVNRWHTFQLATEVPLTNDGKLWITISTRGGGYPAAGAPYSGNDNGSWYHLPDGWQPIYADGFYATWMLRAIMSERPWLVSVDPSEACDATSVYGAGLYNTGETAVVGINDEGFANWGNAADTENPVSFTVNGDTVLHPYCNNLGIDEASGEELRCVVIGRAIIASTEAEVIDALGRMVGRGRKIGVDSPGVYFIRMGNSIKRIIIL